MNKTSIEWTDYTWNPVTGCTKVSQGCKFCYAETMTNRFEKVWGHSFKQVTCHQDRLMEPVYMEEKLRGKRVFVCDMSDLFHEDVPEQFIFDVFETIWNCPFTTFQILTKRPDRALQVMNKVGDAILAAMPLTNVWIGTSVEDQKTADERIPFLLQIPAAVRFLSCEPLLSAINLYKYIQPLTLHSYDLHKRLGEPVIDWVICGGESGNRNGVRPLHPDWARSLRDQCKTAGVPFFFKQWGTWIDHSQINQDQAQLATPKVIDGRAWFKLGKHASGNYLDGVQHLEFPSLKIINL